MRAGTEDPERGRGVGGRLAGRGAGGRGALFPLLVSSALAAGCAGGSAPEVRPVSEGWSQVGTASWYGGEFHGRPTASGERYDQEGMTAAHRRLPFGTWLRVENLENGRRTRVRVTDRGPFVDGRIVDLSRAAAREIGMLGPGTARVRIVVEALPSTATCREVQVGSFDEESNASELADRLRTAGEPARLEDGPPGMTRVVLGPFPDDASARRARREYGGFVRSCGPDGGGPDGG